MGPVKTAGIGAPGVNMMFSILSFFPPNDDDDDDNDADDDDDDENDDNDQEEEQKEEDIKIGDPKTMVNLDDLEGYPNFREPPYTYIIYVIR